MGIRLRVLYTDYVRTLQQTNLQVTTAYYGDNFLLLQVDDVLTSQETSMGLQGPL
jgi:hypothetical protein